MTARGTFYLVRFLLRVSDGKIASICGVSSDICWRKSAEV